MIRDTRTKPYEKKIKKNKKNKNTILRTRKQGSRHIYAQVQGNKSRVEERRSTQKETKEEQEQIQTRRINRGRLRDNNRQGQR